jgi:hypothetical protein
MRLVVCLALVLLGCSSKHNRPAVIDAVPTGTGGGGATGGGGGADGGISFEAGEGGSAHTSVVASGLTLPITVTTDSQWVYFTTDGVGAFADGGGTGTLQRVAHGGGGGATLASGLFTPRSLVVKNGDLYFVDGASGSASAGAIKHLAASASQPDVLSDNESDPEGLAINESTATWTATTGGNGVVVESKPLTGGTARAQVVGTQAGPFSPGAIAIDTVNAYFTVSGGGSGVVLQVALSGATPEILWQSSAQGDPVDIAIDSGVLYFVVDNASPNGAIYSLQIGTTRATAIAPSLNHPTHLAVHKGTVYWTSRVDGTVSAVSTGGGPPQVLTGGLVEPAGITADDSGIYVATRDSILLIVP